MTIREPSYHTDRVVLGERLPLATPLSVILDLSERCNFRCSYCFRSGEKDASWSFAAAGELMSPAVFEKAARQLKEFPQKLKLVSGSRARRAFVQSASCGYGASSETTGCCRAH